MGIIEKLVDGDGKVDHRNLGEALGGKTGDIDGFLREFHLARGAIAIERKALLADAASRALAYPENPHTALHRFLKAQIHKLEEADGIAVAITDKLTTSH